MIFADRVDGGRQLIPKLKQYKGNPQAIVLGLPRGGVVNAYEIAKGLNLPLDVVVPRKIGAPDNPEFAIGAITEDGEGVFDERTIKTFAISQEYIKGEVEKEKKESARRLEIFRGGRPPLDLKGKVAIIVDDGIATGATMRAAIKSSKAKGAKKVVVAVPVTARDSLKKIQAEADEVIYLDAPVFFGAVGAFYKDFAQTEDSEVVELMEKSKDFGQVK